MQRTKIMNTLDIAICGRNSNAQSQYIAREWS